MKKKLLNTNWKMRQIGEDTWINASVPGSVYNDLLENNLMDDPYYRDNEMKALQLMENDYEYICEFELTDKELFFIDSHKSISNDNNENTSSDLTTSQNEHDAKSSFIQQNISNHEAILKFNGLDTIADIYLNGELLEEVSNMHCEWEYSVSDLLAKTNELKVIFHSPTKKIRENYAADPVDGTEDAMRGFTSLRKAHCMFGWDWGPRLPDMGIWRDVELLFVEKARFEDVRISQEHYKNEVLLYINIEIELVDNNLISSSSLNDCSINNANNNLSATNDSDYEINITIIDPYGEIIIERLSSFDMSSSPISIENPKLWWPHGYGEQPLYTIKVNLISEENILDTVIKRIGLREVSMDTSPDETGKPGNNFAHIVNGVKIFAMGADYIPEDNILHRMTPERSRELLEQCIAANFNSIRIWGGGHYPADWFYDICDELGLLVWQDFMFACANYRLTKEFEESIELELRQNIRRLRHHASLGLWCGNNEMEKFAKIGEWNCDDKLRADYIKMYEYLFPRILEEEDPDRFYWPASPSSGGGFDDPDDPTRGDVHYWDVWHGNKPFTEYRKFQFRYLSEFGFQSFPSIKTIEAFTLPEDRNVFSYVMEKHQRNAAANGKIMNYMQQMYLYPTDFESFIYASQLLQAEAIRYGVEHFRRNRGYCMGTVYWQLNDCWPVVSWASIDYYGRWKALHYYAKRFFAPLMISCEEEGLLTQSTNVNAEPFEVKKSIRLNVANETMSDKDLIVKWQLRDTSGSVLKEFSEEVHSPALSATWLAVANLPEARLYEDFVSYQLFDGDKLVSDGTVLFAQPKHFRFVDPALRYEIKGNEITIYADAYAKNVCISNENDDLILSDNFFDIYDGKKTVKILRGNTENIKMCSVYDIR